MKYEQTLLPVFSTFALFIGLNLSCLAQNKAEEDDELLTKSEKTVKDYTSKVIHQRELSQAMSNEASVQQIGTGNTSSINQSHNGGQNPNVVILMQNGNNNESSVNQVGSGNSTIVDQNGNNNTYNGQLTGNENTAEVKQWGNRNKVDQVLTGDNMQYQIIQDGNNNQIIHIDNGTGATPPKIIQDGNNMNIRIEVK